MYYQHNINFMAYHYWGFSKIWYQMTIDAILQQPPPPKPTPLPNLPPPPPNKQKAGKAILGLPSLKHATLIIKYLFSLQVIQLSNSQIICNKNDYTVVYSNGTFKRCLSCGKCHEGYGLYPPCGSKLFHPPMSECRSCKAQTFSSKYDSSSCKACHHCAEHEIKEAECTNKNDTACSGKCKQGYFMSKTVHNCQECSACCSDGKDEKIKECVGLGIKNKECSPRPDKTCADQPSTTDATKGSGGLATKYLIIIIVSTIIVAIAVVIMIVMVCLRRNGNRESSVREPEAPAVKEMNGSASIIGN